MTLCSVIHRADYLRVLVDEANQLGVEIRLDCQVARVDCSAPYAELENRERIHADVIVGADGKIIYAALPKTIAYCSRLEIGSQR